MKFYLALSTIFLLLVLPLFSHYNYFVNAESLPSYCSVENGETICIIEILPFAEPNSYNPSVAEIPVGATVIFKNTGPEIHTATSTDASEDQPAPIPNGLFDSDIVGIGKESVPITMSENGTFRFFCRVHPDMRGTLVVGGAYQGSLAAQDSSPNNIPDWVRNNAGWWADGQIKDSDFTSGIQFMIKENIIVISDLPDQSETLEEQVPDWIRNNAGWWADGLISDEDFVSGIKYLVENGIILV